MQEGLSTSTILATIVVFTGTTCAILSALDHWKIGRRLKRLGCLHLSLKHTILLDMARIAHFKGDDAVASKLMKKIEQEVFDECY